MVSVMSTTSFAMQWTLRRSTPTKVGKLYKCSCQCMYVKPSLAKAQTWVWLPPGPHKSLAAFDQNYILWWEKVTPYRWVIFHLTDRSAVTLQQQKQPFYNPLSGTTWVSWYQKKHSPTYLTGGYNLSCWTREHVMSTYQLYDILMHYCINALIQHARWWKLIDTQCNFNDLYM